MKGATITALQKYLVNYMKTQPFSLINDRTRDTGIKKIKATCGCDVMLDCQKNLSWNSTICAQ